MHGVTNTFASGIVCVFFELLVCLQMGGLEASFCLCKYEEDVLFKFINISLVGIPTKNKTRSLAVCCSKVVIPLNNCPHWLKVVSPENTSIGCGFCFVGGFIRKATELQGYLPHSFQGSFFLENLRKPRENGHFLEVKNCFSCKQIGFCFAVLEVRWDFPRWPWVKIPCPQ